MGAETIPVIANYLFTKWFKGSSFSIAFNISCSYGFFILSLNGFIEPLIYNTENLDMLGWCFFIGVCLSGLSFIVGFFVTMLHRRA